MKNIRDIFNLYIATEDKSKVERDFAQWMLDPHDSDLKEKELQTLWVATPSDSSSVHSAKRKVDSVIFPERTLIRKYRTVIAGVCAVAASLAVALILIVTVNDRISHERFASVSTMSGQSSEIMLEDGTKVVLNSRSQLIYPKKFSGDVREVFLTGEAVFDVAENKAKPFIVNVSDYSIEVLGTVFNISDYIDDDYSTLSLEQGRVKVNVPGMKPIYVEENQGIIYDKCSGTLEKINVDAYSAMLWSDGVMCFEGSDIYEIIKMAERTYGVKIICSDHSKYTNAKITARFEACGGVSSLLEVLEKLIPDMQYYQHGSIIYLK